MLLGKIRTIFEINSQILCVLDDKDKSMGGGNVTPTSFYVATTLIYLFEIF